MGNDMTKEIEETKKRKSGGKAKREKTKSKREKRWKVAKFFNLFAPTEISEMKNWKGRIKQNGERSLKIPPISTSKNPSTKKLITNTEVAKSKPRKDATKMPSPKYSFSFFLSSLLASKTLSEENEA